MLPGQLIEKEENWTKCSSARCADDSVCNVCAPEAAKWCMLGAIAHCFSTSRYFFQYVDILNYELGQRGLACGIEFFNDHHATHAEVLEVMRAADKKFLEKHPDAA